MKKSKFLVPGFIIVAFILGFIIRGGGDKPGVHEHAVQQENQIEFWTCSMHPQIRQPGPGQCPICAMDLIPVSGGDSNEALGLREHRLSERAMKLADIQTAPVERKFVTAEIRMDGKIEYDETRLSYITAWVPGRIDRLFVDYTGTHVSKGDHLVSLYSPELVTTQQELLLGLKRMQNQSSRLLKSTQKNVEATREKLRLWGLTENQIKQIERSKKVSDHTTIYSPMSGIVIQKSGFEGMYVDTGTRIYTVADLSHVWVKLDAYESDLVWIRYGQKVEFETKAYPGEVFNGQITFIDPILNSQTRTVKVRVNVPNPEGKLKPEMFVSARVYPQVASGGKVMDPSLSDKWICPMHPEIVKESKDICDICGMPLVTTESLGYVAADKTREEAPLVIPATAPLITGKRAVVYVAAAGKQGVFEGREVTLGPRAGDYYLVKDGLKEGEQVVVNGNFKIDSAVQILAKPSMMNPEGGGPAPGQQHQGGVDKQAVGNNPEVFDTSIIFKKQIDALVAAYFTVHNALSQDSFKEARDGAQTFVKRLTKVEMTLLNGKAHMTWMNDQKTLHTYAQAIARAKALAEARTHFEILSDKMYTVTKTFGVSGKVAVYRFYCPMAFNNKGAYWLQQSQETENPYFGSAMFRCGTQEEVLSAGMPGGPVHE